MRTMKWAPVVAGALVLFTGCSGAAPATPPAVTVTQTVHESTPANPGALSRSAQTTVLQALWDEYPADQKTNMCWYWGEQRSAAVDIFLQSENSKFDRATIEDFFDSACD